jgi:hypothetical protein
MFIEPDKCHTFNPLFKNPQNFTIDEGESFIRGPGWVGATCFISVGLLRDWEIMKRGTRFWITPEVSVWAHTLALFGAVLDIDRLYIESQNGGLKYGTSDQECPSCCDEASRIWWASIMSYSEPSG